MAGKYIESFDKADVIEISRNSPKQGVGLGSGSISLSFFLPDSQKPYARLRYAKGNFKILISQDGVNQ